MAIKNWTRIKSVLVKNFVFFSEILLQMFRRIPWVFRFISVIFVKFPGQNWIFPPGNLATKMCKILNFILELKFFLENSRNSLSNSCKKAESIGKNIFLNIHQKFHEFSGKQNLPGIGEKKTRTFLLGPSEPNFIVKSTRVLSTLFNA